MSKKITQFYQVSLIVIMFCTLGTILYFWKLGVIDGSRSKELHKASYILETYESKNIVNELKDLITNENPKKAIRKAKEIERDFEKVNSQAEVKEYAKLKTDIQKLKTSAANIISFSKMSKVINVFNSKMDKFYDYVKLNKWKTLGRMSDRVFSQTNGHINKNKLGVLVRNVNRDFNSMIKITENSVLNRKDKSEIVSRITNLQIEIIMLKKYADERKFFNQIHSEAKGSIKSWLSSVAPEITLQKLKIEQIGRYYVMGLLGILFLVTGIFFFSFLVNRVYFRKAQQEIEDEIEGYISHTILEGAELSNTEYSDSFKSYSKNMSSYFNKRMSFGSIFQDALPLSSILLDKNLKVLWANKQFCDDWIISEEEIKKDYMSWDFLNKLTNIGQNDPVLEALKHNIAGIYQVQVKPNESSSPRPYEMFVSPVTFNGESRIMLFFYDLTNLEQTIQDQARSLISPIHKSLSLMYSGKFNSEKELAHEFNIAGIDEIYEKFINLHNSLTEKESNLIDQIECLHLDVENNERKNKFVLDNLLASIKNSKNSVNSLKSFKENVVNLSGLSRDLDRSVQKGQEVIFANLNALKSSITKVNTLKSVSSNTLEAMPKFYSMKEQIKESKLSLFESKSKLSHELSQLTILMKRANDPIAMEKIGRTLTKVNTTFSSLSTYSEELDKKVSNLELMMSKAQIVMDSNIGKLDQVSTDFEVQQLQFAANEVKGIKRLSQDSNENIELYEHEIIESLQSLFMGTKSNISLNVELKKSLDVSELPQTNA